MEEVVALGDLELFLEACEHPVNVVSYSGEYSVLMDYTSIKTGRGRPKLLFRLYDRKAFAERAVERNGVLKLTRDIVNNVYSQEMPDLEVSVKTSTKDMAYAMEDAFETVSYELPKRGSFWSGLVYLGASPLVLNFARQPQIEPAGIRAFDVFAGLLCLYMGATEISRRLAYSKRRQKNRIAESIKVGTF